MEFVVEDPQRTGGITTYHPAEYEYDEATELWSLRLGEGDEVERRIPRERIVYIEGAAEDTSDQ
ncbi:hypothetical protein [Haloarcula salinisoli]|uniref:Uncharacterized protein n=1 Tax=Haloarcula salinisoli TaxID=2487746 RepID=A0A8J8C9T4_9EURY|nr:hypothetical protein [Halomicroarcula salinisoli]MBX0288275.1 hypothetical protein [Halomicroarcula salinisoli]MBX0305936.1 hypothetical protein [Halomicroarcula salinisoli]